MTKVCILNLNVYGLFDPTAGSPMGGAELDMFTLAQMLQETHDVSVVTGDWGQPKQQQLGAIKIYSAAKTGAATLRKSISWLRRIWQALQAADADVYISSGAGLEPGIAAAFCQLNNRSYIYRTAHMIDCDRSFIRQNGWIGRTYQLGLEHASLVVTSVQDHAAVLATHHPVLKNRLDHVNLGLDIHNQPPLSQHQRTGVLWVGRCHPQKQPELFLDLAQALAPEPCTMICPSRPDHAALARSVQQRAHTLPNLTFVESVPFASIQPYFDRARLFVNTSNEEGFTYTLLQSGIAGTPVAYLTVNPDNVITKRRLGSVGNNSLAQLTIDARSLLSDTALWQLCSTNIANYVRTEHEKATLTRRWTEAIARAVDSHKR